MATRLDTFPGDDARPPRRYPWDQWTDGSPWQIRRGEDYDVPTENMRVSLHMKADSLACKVRTHKFDDDHSEGLIFQFRRTDGPGPETGSPSAPKPPEGATTMEQLYVDAVEIYERARREVLIPRKDGSYQKYAANRYKQAIDGGYAKGELVSVITGIVSRPTQGFGHLGNAGREDLMLETLVTDPARPYHRLFSPTTVRIAQERLDKYRESRN
jgi:hypothetical protein